MFHHALLEQHHKKNRKYKKNQKHSMAKVIGGSIMKRYEFKTIALNIIGAKSRITISGNRRCISKMACKYIEFFERGDNSRIITGLNDTLTNLHHKYQAEGNYKMDMKWDTSFSVVLDLSGLSSQQIPNLASANCARIPTFYGPHYQKYKFSSEDLNTVLVKSVCDKCNKSCMYSECESCAETQVQIEVLVTVEDLVVRMEDP